MNYTSGFEFISKLNMIILAKYIYDWFRQGLGQSLGSGMDRVWARILAC